MDRELAEEFRFHVEHEVESNSRAGMSPSEARAAALRKFGGEDRHAEATRDARGARWLDDLRSDLKLALRAFRRTPGASAAAVLTLAIGIGATVVVFGVNGVLLEPLPYPQSYGLAAIQSRFLPACGFDFPEFPLSRRDTGTSIRLALGARRSRVAGLVVARGLAVAAVAWAVPAVRAIRMDPARVLRDG